MPRWTIPIPTLRGSYAGRVIAGGTALNVPRDSLLTRSVSLHAKRRMKASRIDLLRQFALRSIPASRGAPPCGLCPRPPLTVYAKPSLRFGLSPRLAIPRRSPRFAWGDWRRRVAHALGLFVPND